jgi:hypothetical protein
VIPDAMSSSGASDLELALLALAAGRPREAGWANDPLRLDEVYGLLGQHLGKATLPLTAEELLAKAIHDFGRPEMTGDLLRWWLRLLVMWAREVAVKAGPERVDAIVLGGLPGTVSATLLNSSDLGLALVGDDALSGWFVDLPLYAAPARTSVYAALSPLA